MECSKDKRLSLVLYCSRGDYTEEITFALVQLIKHMTSHHADAEALATAGFTGVSNTRAATTIQYLLYNLHQVTKVVSDE